MRIDKFLHSVRYFKTRNLASDACRKNHVRVNDEIVKASKEIVPGDHIRLRKGPVWLFIKVIGIPDNRVGAKKVGLYIVDETPKENIEIVQQRRQDQNYYRAKGEGRPTKKDRRELDDFLSTDDPQEKKD